VLLFVLGPVDLAAGEPLIKNDERRAAASVMFWAFAPNAAFLLAVKRALCTISNKPCKINQAPPHQAII
jgi:hypothetical protein